MSDPATAELAGSSEHAGFPVLLAREGRTRQLQVRPGIAALRFLQVRHEDVAEDAEAAQEIGMWPM